MSELLVKGSLGAFVMRALEKSLRAQWINSQALL